MWDVQNVLLLSSGCHDLLRKLFISNPDLNRSYMAFLVNTSFCNQAISVYSVELTSCSSSITHASAETSCQINLRHTSGIHSLTHMNWCCVWSGFILYLCLPFLPFHPSCHLCHLFLGYPHSHLLPVVHSDQVCQASPVTQAHCRSDVVLLSAWCQTAVQRCSGTDRPPPSMPTSSNL